jgi:hypothetical protein
MDTSSFLDRQNELRERLRHAVPRSARAKALQAALRDLVTDELRRESAGEQRRASAPAPLPQRPPREFRERVGDSQPRQGDLYGGRTPYWVDY